MTHLLSLCMIVKNEEKVLRRCLDSAKSIADEIIIVDTGSTDNTVSIAKEYTEKVYSFPWTGNFSEARNESIKRASGKWILVLDADEYLPNDSIQELRAFLQQTNVLTPTSLVLPILNIVGDISNARFIESNGARIFSNNQGIHYQRPIHEQLISNLGKISYLSYHFYIYHTGYTKSSSEEKEKAARNMKIFESIQDQQPLDSYYCFTLGNEYQRLDNHKKAVYYYNKACRGAKPTDSWLIHCKDRLIHSYLQMNMYKDAYDLIEAGLKAWVDYPDYYCLRGMIYDHFGFYQLAIQDFKTSIAKMEQQSLNHKPLCLVSPDYGHQIPYLKLGEIYTKLHQIQDAVFCWSKLIHSNPKDYTALFQLAISLSQRESFESITSFFEQLYPSKEPLHSYMLFRIFLRIGREDLAKHYLDGCSSTTPRLDGDLLRYGLLINNQEMFEGYFHKINWSEQIEPETAVSLLEASLAWSNEMYLQPLRTMEDYKERAAFVEALLASDEESFHHSLEPSSVSALMAQLVILKHYNAFDKWVNIVADKEIIQALADFFYDQGNLELAIDYYSVLINNEEIHASGLEKLAFLYFSQKEVGEGYDFLLKAVELNPKNPSLYGLLLENANSSELKNKIKESFSDQFPHCKGLPFIRNA